MNRFAAMIFVFSLLAGLASSGTALESKVLMVTEKTLSVDLGPSYEILGSKLNTSDKGMTSQDFIINDTASSGSAFLSVMSVYDAVMGRLSPSVISEIFLTGGLAGVQERGDKVIGNWTATSGLGENVAVHVLSSNDSRIESVGGKYDVMVWNLGNSNYIVMTSLLDKNNTTQVIKTLTIN
ncbi:MAG: hypothetical protein EHM14_01315 [Methanothrix sp.]|nr:MAG: hypothetical protein EHM14_01315 [Methanothrix sp.]